MIGVNRATIPGTLDDVLAVAVPVERWAALMPAYRWVRCHGPGGAGLVFQFTAWNGVLPLRWTAEQDLALAEGRITYRHLGGPTNGLTSEWRFVPNGDWVEVTVRHDWQPEVPLLAPLLARLVSQFWIEPLTEEALHGIAHVVARGHGQALRQLSDALGR